MKINISPAMTTPATTAAAIQPSHVRWSATAIRQQYRRSKSFSFPVTTASPPTPGGRRFAVAASRSRKEESNSKSDDSATSTMSEDDVSFLLKLVAGSFAGGAAIKYGSILLPEITRPNIVEALVMISTPVVVAVLVLINESSVKD